MSVTLHKILVHGSEIVRHSVLPVGMPAEEAEINTTRMTDFSTIEKSVDRQPLQTFFIEQWIH